MHECAVCMYMKARSDLNCTSRTPESMFTTPADNHAFPTNIMWLPINAIVNDARKKVTQNFRDVSML